MGSGDAGIGWQDGIATIVDRRLVKVKFHGKDEKVKFDRDDDGSGRA